MSESDVKRREAKIRQASDGMGVSALFCFQCLVSIKIDPSSVKYDQTEKYCCAYCRTEKVIVVVRPDQGERWDG